MNKPVLGLVLGAVLGCVDGASAWFYGPKLQEQIRDIVIGSTFKGLLVGVLLGWLATRKRSVPAGLVVGLVLGTLLAYLVALMGDKYGDHYYWEIMLPGAITGMIVGYATQKFGRTPSSAAR
ncbi:MAG: hypothetical protein ACKVWV_03135 [Planctomycetota bacterium]